MISGEALGVGSPVKLGWDNGLGQRFTKTISVDEDYMFTIEQIIT